MRTGPTSDATRRPILTSRVYEVAREAGQRLSARYANSILLKREDLQPVFSFNVRGAYTKLVHLSDAERTAGVICASDGNHAQGMGYAARRLGSRARIVMPRTTSAIKVEAVSTLGAKAELHGDAYQAAEAHCEQLVASTGLTYVHPFDDPLVIAG